MTEIAAGRRPLSGLVAWAERRSERVSVAVLAALMVLAAIVLYRQGSGLTFYYDEWSVVIERRDWDLDAFLEPHNEHIALLPVAVFKLLFVTVGLDGYWAHRLVAIALHLACVVLLFMLLRRRVGEWLALIGAALILFLGSAWQDLLWPFQIGFVGSVASGLAMLLALDRRDRGGDVAAAVLLAVSLAFSSIGIPFAVAALVDVLMRPRRLGCLWIPLAPLALWGLWYASYGKDGVVQGTTLGTPALLRENIPAVPGYAADMVASGFGALAGLGLEWGRPLALVAVALLALRVGGSVPVPPRVLTLLAAAAVYWGLTAAFRAQLKTAAESRYMYLSAILLVLIGAEFLRGVRVTRRGFAVLAVLVAAAALGNFGKVREGSVYLHDWSGYVAAELGALELAGDGVDPQFRPDTVRAPPVFAGPYLEAVDDLGSPADSPEEILARPEPYRQAADTVLVQALRIGPFSGRALPETGGPPTVAAAEGRITERGPCVTFRPASGSGSVEVEAASDLIIRNSAPAAAEYRLRSFADTYPQTAHGSLPGGSIQTLPLGRKPQPRAWRLRVTAPGALDVCSA